MKNVVDFPDIAAIDEEAAAWLVRLDSEDPLSAEEETRIAEWLERSPVHRERLQALAALWEKLNVLTELAVPLAESTQTQHRARRTSLATAAACAVGVVGALLAYALWFDPPSITDTNGLYSSAIGEQRSTRLVDSSEVFLNTNSQIRVDYSGTHRDVHLMQGEALFVVAKDESRRFRVFAGGGRIDAVGTAFSVYLKGDAVDITVTEGEVAVSSAAAPAVDQGSGSVATVGQAGSDWGTLRAGQIATLPRLDDPISVPPTSPPESRDIQDHELQRRMSWTNGNLIFSGDPLERVVGEISRYTTVNIEFADPEVGEIRVGGVFPVGETGPMFDALEQTFGLTVTYLSPDRVRISAGE